MGNSIIGEEILGASDLKDVLEEAQVSITNPIIVTPSVPYPDRFFCVFAFYLVYDLAILSLSFREIK